MKNSTFKTLVKIINDADYNDVIDCDFMYGDNIYFDSASIQVTDEYYIKVDENRNVFVTDENDHILFKITNETKKNWIRLSENIFEDNYSEYIKKAKADNAYWNKCERADAKNEMAKI